MGKMHKEIAKFMVQEAQSEQSNDHDLIKVRLLKRTTFSALDFFIFITVINIWLYCKISVCNLWELIQVWEGGSGLLERKTVRSTILWPLSKKSLLKIRICESFKNEMHLPGMVCWIFVWFMVIKSSCHRFAILETLRKQNVTSGVIT